MADCRRSGRRRPPGDSETSRAWSTGRADREGGSAEEETQPRPTDGAVEPRRLGEDDGMHGAPRTARRTPARPEAARGLDGIREPRPTAGPPGSTSGDRPIMSTSTDIAEPAPARSNRRRLRDRAPPSWPSSSAIALDTKVVRHRLRGGRRRGRLLARGLRRREIPRDPGRASSAARSTRRRSPTPSPPTRPPPPAQYGVAGRRRRGDPGHVHRRRRRGQVRHLQRRRRRPRRRDEDPGADRPGDQRHRPARRHRRDQVRPVQEPDRVPERRRGASTTR